MFKKNKKNNKGFTLVELVIVIAILAILVGLLAPQYTKYVEKSRKAADPTNELVADTYTIKISAVKATGTDKSTTITPGKNTTDVTKLKEEMDKTIPNWFDTVTKSKKWKSGKSAAIIAIVTVNEDGGTSVSYKVDGDGTTTDPFANYMKTGTDGIQ